MALPNRIRIATYTFDNASIQLQATFANLEKLKQHTGIKPFDFIFTALSLDDPDGMIENVRDLLYCLQVGETPETVEAIHNWLFGSFTGFFNEDNLLNLANVINDILGEDLKVEAGKDSGSTAATQKK